MRRSPDLRAYVAYDPCAAAWRDVTWREAGERAGRFRLALQALGLKKGDRVAVLLPNGIDWVAFDMAALGLGLIVVPLYLRDGVENQADILARSGARLLLVDTAQRWARISGPDQPAAAVEQVWVSEAAPDPLPRCATRLDQILAGTGPGAWADAAEARPEDIATLIFTSGTTGPPKGVALTHAAILWNAEAVTSPVAPSADDVFLSILPLAHAFERTVGYYLPMMAAATVAYSRSAELLGRDLLEVRPTVFLAVPRLYERSYAEAGRRAARWPLGAQLLRLAADVGWRRLERRRGRGPPPSAFDRIAGPVLRGVFSSPFLAAFGGRLRVAVSGGARLPEALGRSLAGLGVPLVEGYGLTEAGPVVTGTSLEDYVPGSVGRPLADAHIRLSDQGELLVRSPGLMRGYWQDAEATAAAFEDGWLRTGDLADIRDGRVFMRGRLNDVVVLATGEKFDPELVETAILRDPLFEQACVVGDGGAFAVAVLVLAQAPWRSLAGRLGLDPERPNADLAKAELLGRIGRALVDFPEFAQVRDAHVVCERWTIEEGLLTPTLKVKRRAVRSRYAGAIASLYDTRAASG